MTPCSKILLLATLLVNAVHHSVAPPVTQKPEPENDVLENIGVEYERYLREVVQTLESDNEFRSKLEKAEDADLRSGKIAQELQYVRHDVRSKLDELKRAELQRLRHYIRRQAELKQGLDPNHVKQFNDQTGHIDGSNPHSFEIADLEKLIAKTTQHLAEADRRRREEFKQYELQKEFERKQERKTMNERDKSNFDDKLQKERSALRHRQMELHHPASKKQLEEVWQYQDHMNIRDFDPKTFFFMHDVDGNGFLDQEEVKALFLRELAKLYNMGYPGEDLRERTEEMERMREHVFVEADTNRDGVISLHEWLELTRRPDFNSDPGWDVMDPRKEFTAAEYRQFEQQRLKEVETLIAQGKLGKKSQAQMEREARYAKEQREGLALLEKRRQEYVRLTGNSIDSLPPLQPLPLLQELEQEQREREQQQQQQQQPPHPQQVPLENYSHDQPDHAEFQKQLQAAQHHAQQQVHPQEQAHPQQAQQLHTQQAQQLHPQQLHPQQAQQLHPQQAQQLHPQQAQQLHPQQAQQLHPQQAQQLHPQQAQQLNLQQQPAQQQDQHPQQASLHANVIPQHGDNNIHQ